MMPKQYSTPILLKLIIFYQINLYKNLTIELGFPAEPTIATLQLLGADDDYKVIMWLTEYVRITELSDKFPPSRVIPALIHTQGSFEKAVSLLKLWSQWATRGASDALVFETLSNFRSDVNPADAYLQCFFKLKEFGFQDLKIKEALVLHTDQTKALEYLMEHS
jgi:hypothetical protein